MQPESVTGPENGSTLRPKSRLLSLGLLTAALCLSTSCVSSDGAATNPGAIDNGVTQPQTLSEVQWGSGKEVSARVVELGAATEVAFEDQFTVQDSTDNWQKHSNFLSGLGLSSQGEVLGELSQQMRPTQADTKLSDHGEIGLAKNGEFTAFGSTRKLVEGDGNRTVTSALSTDDGYLWVESPNYGSASRTWRLFTGGPGNQSKLLAKSKNDDEFGNDEWNIEVAVPVADDKSVYWSTLTTKANGSTSSAVLQHSLSEDDKSKIFADDATNPAVLDQGIAVLDLVTENGTEKNSEKHVAKSISLHTKQADPEVLLTGSSLLDDTVAFTGLVGQGETLMTQLADKFLVTNLQNKDVIAVALPADSRAVGYAICGQHAAWQVADSGGASDGWQYLLDLETNELSKVAKEGLTGTAFCNGDYFAWGVRGTGYSTNDAYVEVMKWKK